MGISIAYDTRIDHYVGKPSARDNFGKQGRTGESGFDPVELWVMGPPCGLKAGRVLTFCTVVITRQVRG